eukprot:1736839-Rhodomonas_salina.1
MDGWMENLTFAASAEVSLRSTFASLSAPGWPVRKQQSRSPKKRMRVGCWTTVEAKAERRGAKASQKGRRGRDEREREGKLVPG